MKKFSFKAVVKKDSSEKRLDQIVFQSQPKLASFSKSLIRKLIVAGAVYVNGKRVRVASRSLKGGEHIDIYFNEAKTKTASPEEAFLPLRILYQDEAIICFDKPAGLPTQPTLDEARANLFSMAKKQLNEHSRKPIYLGLHHRLDRDTSGAILFTLDRSYNKKIAEQFKNHTASKIYVAVVHGKLVQSQGSLESFLGEIHNRGKQTKFGTVRSGGKKAITDYLVLKSTQSYSLVEVKIKTGRTHQIRVHLSELGHPIVGDTLYGSPVKYYQQIKRHLLHAMSLSIVHPMTQRQLLIESPIPEEFRKWVSNKP